MTDAALLAGFPAKTLTQYQQLQSFYDSLVASGAIPPGTQIDVAGHSLGGYLTQAFAANNPNAVDSAVTFNAPGMGGLLGEVSKQLGLMDTTNADFTQITNIVDGDGISIASGLGSQLGLTIVLPGSPFKIDWKTHSIVNTTKKLEDMNKNGVELPEPALLSNNRVLDNLREKLENSRFPGLPPGSNDTRLHNYPANPITNWREKLRNPTSPNDPRLPDPAKSNTYRIVWIPGGDPLVLDLDGDGVETVNANGHSGAMFDHNNDGIKTATGWIKGDDGLLVRDINGNGTIDNGAELFGDSTRLASGATATNGFAALSELDSNQDGKIDTTDVAFSELKVWRDLNQDGVSQTGELFTLADLGIQSLNTANTAGNTVVPGGNQILTGNYSNADGTTATLADSIFAPLSSADGYDHESKRRA